MRNNKPIFLKHQDAALLNRNAVLDFIKENSPVSRTDIWEQMNLSRASVTQIVKHLIEENLVIEKGVGNSNGGRKPNYLEFNKFAKYILVFDWYSKSFCVTNLIGEIIYRKQVELNIDIEPQKFIEVIVGQVKKALSTTKLDKENVIGLGLVMPGIIEPVKGVVKLSVEQGWKNVNIRDMMEDAVQIKTYLDRQGNMDAIGEYLYGRNKGIKDFVLVELEKEGIGMAMIMNNELQRGSNYMIGEFGHIKLLHDGPECSCGKKGCLEAIIKDLLKKHSGEWTKEAIYYIGWGISIIVNMLDPKVIVLSGHLVKNMPETTIQSIKEVVKEHSIGIENKEIIIETSVLGQNAGIKGMCGFIYRNTFNKI